MRSWAKLALAVTLCGLISGARAQDDPPAVRAQENSRPQIAAADYRKPRAAVLSRDDRSYLISVALDRPLRRSSGRDCSHLVHAIYVRAGFPYEYAPSSDIYEGVAPFQRVKRPQSGDLVVWRGHVGMVIQPSKHLFYSFMTAGPGTDDYESPYWKERGKPRFYRYVKDSNCPNCNPSQPSFKRTREDK